MRVGLVTPYSWSVPGGVNQHVEHLAAELEARGHEPWILAPVGAFFRRRSVDSMRHAAADRFVPMGSAVPVSSNHSRAFVSVSPLTFSRVDRTLRYGRFDVLHVHEPCTPVVAGAAVLMASSPIVGTFHAALESSHGYEDWDFLARYLMERIHVRVAVSEAARAYPMARYGGDWRIIPNGIPTERYERCREMQKVPGRILFIGRAEPRKGLAVLLEAFARLREERPEVSLVIAGATRRQALEAHLAAARNGGARNGGRDGSGRNGGRNGLSKNGRGGAGREAELAGVDALGWVGEDQKADQLGAAEVVCAPSLTAESFGIVLAEAMAAGTPVVASDLPGYRSVLRDGAAGRLVPPGDAGALATALQQMLDDAAGRARLRQAGLGAASELSWTRVTDDVLQAYEDAVGLWRQGPPPHDGLPPRLWYSRVMGDYARWRRERRRAPREADTR
jgi:phosphatidylinositol alpha-mannosyltransferase